MNSKQTPSAPELPRRRGRPTTISRDTVIATALRLIQKNPDHDVTMAEVAAELGVVTMGLYKHVRNKDDLLEGMADHVFSKLDLTVDPHLDLDGRFQQWAGKYRTFFLQHPYAHHLIAWHNHLSRDLMLWSADLVAMLREYGVPAAQLARTLVWLSRQLIAYVVVEQGYIGDQRRLVEGFDLASLPVDKQRLLRPLLPKLARFSTEDFYRFHIEATIQSIKQVVAATA